MTFSRIESMTRSALVDDGVAAPTADPLWLLGRQWQLGELTGDDAVQPAAVRVTMRHAPLVSYRSEGGADGDEPGPTRPIPTHVPIETLVERAPEPAGGPAAAFAAAESGERLRRRLVGAGHAEAVELLRGAFPVDPGTSVVRLPAAAQAAATVLRRRGLDGRAIAEAPVAEFDDVLQALPVARRRAVVDIIAAWRTAQPRHVPAESDELRAPVPPGVTAPVAAAVGDATDDAWRPHRFEHRFSLAADTGRERIVLRADEYTGGRVDWFSFDVVVDDAHAPVERSAGAGRPRSSTTTTIATPVSFAGMPASRWWEFEDGEVNLGDLDGGPGDLARLAVAEFAAVYNDDWFLVPVRLRRGELVRVASVDVIDTFGRVHPIDPASLVDRNVIERSAFDAPRDANAGPVRTDVRPWRFLELAGDDHIAEGRAPWMLVAPSLGSSLHGPDLERVVFARDEDANLAWAIERFVEGPLGRAIDRARSDPRRTATSGPSSDADGPRQPRRYGDESWKWQLESTPPPWWIPLVPDRDDPESEQVVLRRARMATWESLERVDAGPKGTLLEPDRPFFVREEEVPRSGATVSRSWQWARWEDGSTHLWLQRRKQNGRGERSAGLEWDALISVHD